MVRQRKTLESQDMIHLSRTGLKIQSLELRVDELENKVSRLMNDLRVRNEHEDFINAEWLKK